MPSESVRPVYASGECEIDLGRRELRISGSRVPIGGRTFEIIDVLVDSAGELVTKDELMNRIWPGAIVLENTLQVHVAAVRKALGPYRSLLRTESRRGYRLIGDWTVGPKHTTRAPIDLQRTSASNGTLRTNFPASITRLVGRASALQRLQSLISAYRVVTLTGPGGIGKTALALTVARDVCGEFADGGWLVELASLSDQGLVPTVVAGVLGLRIESDIISAAAVADAIGDKKLLLVLDSCEHVVNAAANLADVLVRSCPHVTVLSTSREVLRIDGEHVYRVLPLDVPPADEEAADDILAYSAVELLVARIKEADVSFVPETVDLSSITAICRHLDGIPLAIEFGAARAATLGLQTVASGLTDRFALLTAGRRTALPQHRTLRAALDWSYNLLPESERLLLSRLAVFPGGFTVDAAAVVVNDAISDASAVSDGIANLGTKSLIVLRSDAGPRFNLLETIRAYALEKLAQRGDYSAAARRHAEYFRDLLVSVAESTTYFLDADDLVRCGRELDNVRAALDWSFSSDGDLAVGEALTAAFASIWMQISSQAVAGPTELRAMPLAREIRDRVQKLLARQGSDLELSAALKRQMFTAYSMALAMTHEPIERSGTAIRRAQRLSEGTGDIELRLHLLWCQWSSELLSGDDRTCLITARSMRDLAQRSTDGATRLMGDRYLGTSLLYAGRLHEARIHLQRFVDHYVAPGNGRHTAVFHYDQHLLARSKLALILCLSGHIDDACREAHVVFNEAQAPGKGFTFCWVLHECNCRVRIMTGDLAAAETSIGALSDSATKINSALWKSVATAWQGKLLIERGAFAEGVERLRRAFDARDQAGWRFCEAEFLGYLAEGLAALGQLDAAGDTVERAISRAEQSGQHLYHAELIRLRGELLLRASADTQATEAEDCFRRAGELARAQGVLLWELRNAISVARLRIIQGRAGEATRLVEPVFGRFTQDFQTPDLRAARALLDGPIRRGAHGDDTSNATSQNTPGDSVGTHTLPKEGPRQSTPGNG